MNVLLSIKPEFAEKILSQEKQYEFRKTRFRDPPRIETIYMYATSPVQRIVGAFTLENIVEGSPTELWRNYGSASGIDERSRFMDYFVNTDTGYAIEVEDSHRFTQPIDPHQHIDEFHPPVSFQYLQNELIFLKEQFPPRSGSD